ncbi:MAG: ribonuclease HII [Candidatus Omnitrophica bacterium]|nr:ribonuclease HII [Candidatus Omnitrophota bacterium]
MKKRSNTRTANRLLRLEKRLNREGFKLIAGVDEAGRGPLAGPVVAGAVILKVPHFTNRVDDSKKLSERQRNAAYLEIVKNGMTGLGIVCEKDIDEINIHQATKKAMQMALDNLPIKPDYVLVDGIIRLATDCPYMSIIKGDSRCLSIAAASIVAKVTRDKIMVEYDKLYPQYGFARHKGYPTKNHKAALKVHGYCPIHRRTYHPVFA